LKESLYLMMGRYKKVTREADRERRFDRD